MTLNVMSESTDETFLLLFTIFQLFICKNINVKHSLFILYLSCYNRDREVTELQVGNG